MSDSNKKRTSSFRKLIPNLFFSHKSKEKSNSKDFKSAYKSHAESSTAGNQYHDPQIVIKSQRHDDISTENIYENLATSNRVMLDVDPPSLDVSNNSSSSTLVSDSVKNKINSDAFENYSDSNNSTSYAARPQVPRKPYDGNLNYSGSKTMSSNSMHNNKYPDVYYHSLEKISNNLSPIQQIDIYQASKNARDPAPVGAEIKKVSTKFLISPKKEAGVRTIQPNRARSLSLDKSNNGRTIDKTYQETEKTILCKDELEQKPYNYSAPTSPLPVNYRIPSMPKTVSPYEHVRKTMMESEEKRNSINRCNIANKANSSPKRLDDRYHSDEKRKIANTISNDDQIYTSNDKVKTRQKVEAFYWQKLKEQKYKEDELLFQSSVHSTGRKLNMSGKNSTYSNSTCSSPISLIADQRPYSLPRGKEVNMPDYSPFMRGAPERRTDSFLMSANVHHGQEIVYRNPERLLVKSKVTPMIGVHDKNKNATIYQKGSLTMDPKNNNQIGKRVSFEEQFNGRVNMSAMFNVCNKNSNGEIDVRNKNWSKFPVNSPPRPPVRSSSVNTSGRNIASVNNPKKMFAGSLYSESESGSEAGEIQKILLNNSRQEEDWNGDGSRMDGGASDGEFIRIQSRGRISRREDPRRHTLAGGGHTYNHPPLLIQNKSLDLEQNAPVHRDNMNTPEYAIVNKYRDSKKTAWTDPLTSKPPLPRGYQQQHALLFDDDPGIMSEVETASTGFRRGGKQRSSLPVVRTPSKTLERPLGLVFLQYRNETKRALLPNEITSIDTVKALFVRSFPKQLTMQYMDSPMVKIYIHDSSKDMFYELEDDRAHLRDIRDRSILRLFESTDIGGGSFPGAVGAGSLTMPANAANCSGPSSWDQDQSYFSEPEIDSEYHHQHVHKSKVKAPAYYIGGQAPSTLPRVIRAFSPAAPPVPADRVKPLPGTAPVKPLRTYIPGSGSERCFPYTAECPRGPDQLYTIPGHGGDGYMSSPERSGPRVPYEDPYYTQFLGATPGRTTITPVIDEETSDGVIIDDNYQMYGVNAISSAPRPMPRPPFDARLNTQVDDIQRLRVEKMERQLANLTGLVQKALQVPGSAAPPVAPRQEFNNFSARQPAQDAARFASNERPPKLGRDKFQKSVSFEKSVSFSDDPPDMNSPKQHSPQHSADTKPTKPAIKSSTLPRTSSQERDRLKPAPPPKPAGLVGQLSLCPQRNYSINVSPDFCNQLRGLHKNSQDLRMETRNLRSSTLTHSIQMRQLVADTIVKIGEIATNFTPQDADSLTREEEIYRQDMLLLENDLYELEATVERLRDQAANRETRVNMSDIERIAMVLSKSSKTVADWKLKFPILLETMKIKLAAEMEKVVRKEKLLEEEPERLELALRRCKKLTGTLVTLKRLACVQEQRLPITDGRVSPGSSSSTFTGGPSSEEFNSDSTCHTPAVPNKVPGSGAGVGRAPGRGADVRGENALDALLDELQTFARPASARGEAPLRRLHSYPSGSDTDASPPVRARGHHPPKPPVPERHPDLLALAARRAPPPPPPRTTSRSPLASPTSPSSPPHPDTADENTNCRQALLEQRHQELLKKQRALQEQYARLQMIQRTGPTLPITAQPDLKKTGSESNLLTKMSLNLAPAIISGSMTHLAGDVARMKNVDTIASPEKPTQDITKAAPEMIATTNKVYETDIL